MTSLLFEDSYEAYLADIPALGGAPVFYALCGQCQGSVTVGLSSSLSWDPNDLAT